MSLLLQMHPWTQRHPLLGSAQPGKATASHREPFSRHRLRVRQVSFCCFSRILALCILAGTSSKQ